MKKIAALLFALIFLAGCQPTAKLLFGINRQYDFSSREEMAAHFNKKNKIEKDRLYFFDDIAQKNAFMRDELQGTMTGTYYALAVNDSLRMAEDPTADISCPGVVDTFVMGATSDSIMVDGLRVPHGLKGMELSNHLGTPLDLNTPDPTVIFVIHSVMGRAINSSAGYVTKRMKKERPTVNYVYIALDQPVAATKP